MTSTWWGWSVSSRRIPRPLSSVVLPDGVADRLVSDARLFLRSAQWYADRGIPYRRGYLLHGPPGTGKSSFCLALAGELKMDVCLVNLSDASLDDEQLREALAFSPAGSMLLFEDVDGLFVGRDKVSAGGGGGGWTAQGGGGGGGGGGRGGRGGVTFSGLLNALDGVASQQGRITIMTTNHIEKLDPALIRPGRCDVVQEIPHASPLQIRRMFRRFFPEADA